MRIVRKAGYETRQMMARKAMMERRSESHESFRVH
jgi:hypothetical protein